MNIENGELFASTFGGGGKGFDSSGQRKDEPIVSPDILSTDMIDEKFHGVYYFPDMVEEHGKGRRKNEAGPLSALDQLVEKEEARLNRLIESNKKQIQVNRKRVELAKERERQARLDFEANRKRKILQAGQAMVDRQVDCTKLRQINLAKQTRAERQLEAVLAESEMLKLEHFEEKALQAIRLRAKQQVRQQEKISDQSMYRKLKHNQAQAKILEEEKRKRRAIDKRLSQEERRLKEFADKRAQLKEIYMKQKYQLALQRAGVSNGLRNSASSESVDDWSSGYDEYSAGGFDTPMNDYYPDHLGTQQPNVMAETQYPPLQPTLYTQGYPYQRPHQMNMPQLAPNVYQPTMGNYYPPHQPQYLGGGHHQPPIPQYLGGGYHHPPPMQQQYMAGGYHQPSIQQFLPTGGEHQQAPYYGGGLTNYYGEQQEESKAVEQVAETNLASKTEQTTGWFYLDKTEQVQGPFSLPQMKSWHASGLFPQSLLIQENGYERDGFYPLEQCAEFQPEPIKPE